MSPVLLLVVEDAARRRHMTDELASRFARDYAIESSPSTADGLERLRTQRASGVPVAMVLADLNTTSSDAITFLARVREVLPTAVRILLHGRSLSTTDAVRRAAVLGRIDGALAMPTGPRDEDFFGVLTEYLADWAWITRPVVDAVKIVGDAAAAAERTMVDTLRRHAVPAGVYAPDSTEGRRILERAAPDAVLPVVQVLDELPLSNPSLEELADQFGFARDIAGQVYDLAIVGAGPAGLGAAVYGASEGLHTLVIEQEAIGGQAGTSSMIRNYLGFPRGVTGRRLAMYGQRQATRFGAAFHLMRSVVVLRTGDDLLHLGLSSGVEVAARTVLLSCGVAYRRLGVASLEALVGAGVFYGAATGEAQALEGLDVYVVGAGNSAGQAALHLARYAARVTLTVRGSDLERSMSEYLIREIRAHHRIDVRLRTEVVDGGGDGHLERLTLRDNTTGERTDVAAAGLFILIGAEPRTDWLPEAIERDRHGFVRTGGEISPGRWVLERAPAAFETSLPGVFAAGDVRAGSVKRVAAAAGEGAVTVPMIHSILIEHSPTRTGV
jgi:thioredoxin reductase (NADPH)